MSAWSHLTDEQLLERMSVVADRCVLVMALPPAERMAPGAGGSASPAQAGALSAALVLQMETEAGKRGLL